MFRCINSLRAISLTSYALLMKALGFERWLTVVSCLDERLIVLESENLLILFASRPTMSKSPITCHVLDSTLGKPGRGVSVHLERLDGGNFVSLAKG